VGVNVLTAVVLDRTIRASGDPPPNGVGLNGKFGESRKWRGRRCPRNGNRTVTASAATRGSHCGLSSRWEGDVVGVSQDVPFESPETGLAMSPLHGGCRRTWRARPRSSARTLL